MWLDRNIYYNEKLILEHAISRFDSLHISETLAIYRSRYRCLENVLLIYFGNEVFF